MNFNAEFQQTHSHIFYMYNTNKQFKTKNKKIKKTMKFEGKKFKFQKHHHRKKNF